MLKNKIILVTGGLGAIGSYLVNQLSAANTVIVIDNLTSGRLNNLNRTDEVILYKNDIRDYEIMSDIFKSYKIDIVFHLAANFANQNSVDNPILDFEVNAKGTLQLLKIANDYKVERFIYTSSSGVYGSNISEMTEDKIGYLETPYYIHKLLGEQYCNYYYEQYGLKIINIRVFNSYGPGELWGKYRNVIPNFFYKAMNEESLIITGTGEETRDFTFVGDIVDGLILSSLSSNAIGQTINLGKGEKTKIFDLANKINLITGNRQPLIFKEKRSWDNVKDRLAVNKKAKKLLNWESKVNLDEGLQIYYKWLMEQI